MQSSFARWLSQPGKQHQRRASLARRERKRTLRRSLFENLEQRALLATVVWDGGGADDKWTTPENWATDVAPGANDNLVFPSGASQTANTNDFAAGTGFGSILISGSNYSLAGNQVLLNGSVTSQGTGNSLTLDLKLGTDLTLFNTQNTLLSASGAIDLNGHTLSVNNSGTLALDGVISGSGNLGLKGGQIDLGAANTYTGITTIGDSSLAIVGTVVLHDNQSLGDAATGTVLIGGTLRLADSVTAISEPLNTVQSLFATLDSRGDTTWSGDISILGYPLVVQAASGKTLTVTGHVSNGDFQTIGAGTVVLSVLPSTISNFSPNAASTILTGSLTVTNQFFNSGAGGVLSGSGTLDNGTTNVFRIFGTLDPGATTGPGTFHVGKVSLAGTLAAQLNGTVAGTEYDQLQVTGTVQVGGNLNVSLGYVPAIGDSYTIIDNDGADPVSGIFNGLAEGNLVAVGNDYLQISYVGGTGNDVVLTRVAVSVWDGGGADDKWTTPGNWVGDVAPLPGAHLIFPAGAAQTANTNDFAAGTGFSSMLVSGSNYSLAGNQVLLGGSVASQGTGNSLGLDLKLGTDLSLFNTQNTALSTTGAIDLNGHNLSVTNAGTLALDGVISGSGSLNLNGGQIDLGAANSYDGITTISGNGLVILHDNLGLGSTDTTPATGTVLNGGTLRLANTVTSVFEHLTTAQSLFATLDSQGTATWLGDIAINGYPLVAQAAAGETFTLGGHFTQGDFQTSGAGTVMLAMPFATVNNFAPNAAHTILNTLLTVTNQFFNSGAGGVLSGGGTLDNGNNVFRIFGTLNPGSTTAPGTFHVGKVSLAGTLAAQLNGTVAGTEYDQLQVTGTVQVGGNLNVSLGYVPTIGDSYTIIDNDGADPVSGIFNGLAEGNLVVVGNDYFQISYVGGTGNDVVLTRVAISVWDGAPDGGGASADYRWTTATNWVGDVAPLPGAHLIFPSGAAQTANTNDFAAGTGFGSILISGSNYSLAGNQVLLNGSVTSQGTGNSLTLDLKLGTDLTLFNTQNTLLSASGAIDLNGRTLSVNNSGTLALDGVISGSGNLGLKGGQIDLGAANTYTGITTIGDSSLAIVGTVVLHDNQSLGDAATGTVLIGGTLRLADSVTAISEPLNTVQSLFATLDSRGDTTWSGDISILGYPLVVQAASGKTLTLTGHVSNGDFQTIGAGTVVLSVLPSTISNFSPNAASTILTGSLTVTNQFFNSGAGGVLSGGGTLDNGNNVFRIFGTLNPGSTTAPGTFHVGKVSLAGTLAAQLNGTVAGTEYDQLQVTGTVQVGGNLNVSLGYVPTIGDSYTIIDNDGADPVSGIFNGLAEGNLVHVGDSIFSISYVGGTGNDVTLTCQSVILPHSVSGVNWNDLNADGIRQPGEPGLSGWVVFIDLDNDGVRDANEAQATTQSDNPGTPEDEAGQYQLHLPSGTFTLRRLPQIGFAPSYPAPQPGIAPESYVASSHTVTLGNQSLTNIDFGNFANRTVNFSAASQTVSEDAGVVVIQAEIDAPLGVDLTVPVTVTGGSATADSDYVQLDGVLVFPAGSTQGSLRLQVLDDVRFETDEPIVLSIQAAPGAVAGTASSHTLTVINNDATPQVSFSSTGQFAVEGSTAIVSIKLSGETDLPVTVTLVASGSASSQDYSIVGGDTVVIPPGSRSATATIQIVNDTTAEKAETVQLSLGTVYYADPSTAPGDPLQHVITIPVNDQPQVGFGTYDLSGDFVAQTSVTRIEGSGFFDVTVSLSNPTTESVVIPFTISGSAGSSDRTLIVNGTPLPGAATSGTLTIPASAAQHPTGTIRINVVNDSLDEDQESVILTMGSITGGVAGAAKTFQLRIDDNDTAKVEFSASSSAFYEDAGNVSFTVKTSVASQSPIVVPILLSSKNTTTTSGYARSGSDFTALPANYSVTIPAGQLSATGTIHLLNNTANEPNESLVLTIGTPSRGVLGTTTTHTMTVKDNDPIATITSSSSSVTEAATTVNFTVSLDHESNLPVVLQLFATGTATDTRDVAVQAASGLTPIPSGPFSPPSFYLLVIPAHTKSVTIPVKVLNDTLDESSEKFTFTVIPSQGVALPSSNSSASLTINDNDGPPTAYYSTKDFSIKENNTSKQAIKISLTAASGLDIYVKPSFAIDGVPARQNTDYSVSGLDSSGALKIPAGSSSGTFYVTMINRGGYQGDRSFRMKLSSATNAKVNSSSVYVYIVDKDAKPQPRPVSAGTVAIDTTNQVYDIGPYSPGGPEIDIAAIDSVPVGAGIIAISSQGFLDGSTAFFDGNFNGVRDFLDLDGNGIRDDGEPEEPSALTDLDGSFSLFIPAEFDVDGSGFFDPSEGRLVLVGGMDTSTGLAWTTRMYAAVGEFAITPLTTMVSELVRNFGLSVPDAETRVMEAFGLPPVNLGFFNPLAGLQVGDLTSGEYFAAHVGLYSTVAQIAELFAGASAGLPVDYFADLVYADLAGKIVDAEATADVLEPAMIADIINGVSVVTGIDLPADVISGAAQIISEGNLAIVNIPATGDVAYATAVVKTKKVSQGAAAAALHGVGAGALDIADVVTDFTGANLQAKIDASVVGTIFPPTVTVSDAQIREGDNGTKVLEFQVLLTGDHSETVSVDYATADGVALAGADYVATSGTLTWNAGDTTPRTLQVTITGDQDFEQDELFQLVLSNAQHLVIRKTAGIGFILNDDAGQFTTDPAPADGANELVLRHSDLFQTLLQNGVEVADGTFFEPLDYSIFGQDNVSDTLTLDFTANNFRSDVIDFQGGGGSGSDGVVIQGGSFETITHKLLNATDGQTLFTPQGSDQVFTLNWFGLEPFTLGGDADQVIFELPAGVTNVVLEDADPTDLVNPGMMRLRSTTGDFETTMFANPGVSLTIRGGAGADSVTILSLDPAFGADLIVDGNALGTDGTTVSATNMAFLGDLTVEDATFVVNGIVQTTGTLSFNSGTTVQFELAGTAPGFGYGQLGGAEIALGGASLNVSVNPSFTPALGDSFVLINNAGANAISGTFQSLPDESLVVAGSSNLRIDYGAGTGNDLALTSLGPNNAPTGDDQTVTVAEEGAVSIVLTGNDVDGNAFSFAIDTPPAHGTLTGTAPNLTYTPDANFSGPDSFTFRVTDTPGASSTATITINVTPVNDAPTATFGQGSFSATEQVALSLTSLTGLAIDDVDAGSAVVEATVSVVSGTLSADAGSTGVTIGGTASSLLLTGTLAQINAFFIGSGGATLSYLLDSDTPPPSDTLTLFVHDLGNTGGGDLSASATASITITAVNDAPVADDQSISTAEDTAEAITLTGSDPEGSSLTYVVVTPPAHGTLTGTAPNLTYTPTGNYNGPDSFTFKVNDGTIDSVTATVSITVSAVNDAPIATNLSAAETYTEDTPLNLIDIVVSDVDSTNVTATLTLSNTAAGTLSTGTSGSVTSTFNAGTGVWTALGAVADVNALLAGLTFTPALNFNGAFTINTSVSDNDAPAITGSKALTGNAVNDAPTATNLSAAETYTEDTPLNLIDIVVSDVDSANVTATLTLSNPAVGSLSTGTSGSVTSTFNAGTGVWTASGAIADVNALLAGATFTPALNFNGNFTISTSVSDNAAPAITGSKALTGVAVNDAPTANAQSVTLVEDTSAAITLTGSDVDGNPLTYIVVSPPAHGTLSGTAPNLTYTPAHNYNGPDSFTFKVNDGTVDSASVIVSITVTPDAPTPLLVGFNPQTGVWQGTTLPQTGSSQTKPLAQWATMTQAGWQNGLSGDFDGDGTTDVAARNRNGAWYVGASQVNGYATSVWGGFVGHLTWSTIQVGDVNADGKDDIVGYLPAYGEWWAAISTGTSFQNQVLARFSTSVTWSDLLVADFTGDGRDDVAGRTNYGEWWMGETSASVGTQSRLDKLTTWSTSVTWRDVKAADMNGDGKQDIVGRADFTGSDGSEWWLAQTRLAAPNDYVGDLSALALWYEPVGWTVVIADTDGNGSDEILGRTSYGEWWQASKLLGKNTVKLGQWDNTTWDSTLVGDVDGDGKEDLIGLKSSGQWTVSRFPAGPGSQVNSTPATWNSSVDWLFSAFGEDDDLLFP